MSNQKRDVPGDGQLKELWIDMGDSTWARRVSTIPSNLALIAEGEVTVAAAGTPEPLPSNTNAKMVVIHNNNVDGKVVVPGLAATVNALSVPPIGAVLQANDSVPYAVSANSNEIAVDATVNGTKATYQIFG